jgi:hypothetical protein
MLKVKRINREDVQPVKFIDEEEDKRPFKGRNIFSEPMANVFFCARKKSGKSCAIYHAIKNCATTETQVIAFVSTLHRDPTWRSIKHLCEKMKVEFTGYTSLKDPTTKEDILDTIIKHLENEEDNKEDEKEAKTKQNGWGIIVDDDYEAEGKNKKKRKPKERAPKYIFCFDDLSSELQFPSLTSLMKKNRQFKSMLLIASQNFNDLALQARKQLDYFLAWKGLGASLDKMNEIYRNLDLSVPFEVFLVLYRFATAKKFCFLYVDVVNSEFRKNFTYALMLPEEKEEKEVLEL